MPIFPTCDFPLLEDSAAIARVREAVASRQPFSLIRLGDGEAVVMSFSDDMWLQDLAYLHGHWGAEGVSLRAISEVKEGLDAAVDGADIVGIRDDVVDVSLPEDLLDRPGSQVREIVASTFHLRAEEVDNLSGIGARRLALMHRILSSVEWSEQQEFCSAWIHWELLAGGALTQILESVDEVGLVTSRPELEHLVSRRFGIRATSVLVPDKLVEGSQHGEHVPTRYAAIHSELSLPPGTLVLVGAGIPGKVYCQWLKEAGCVAVDVGSIFDAWIGKASRPRVLETRFKVTGGGRVPEALQLRLTEPSGDRRLSPRWKPSGVSS